MLHCQVHDFLAATCLLAGMAAVWICNPTATQVNMLVCLHGVVQAAQNPDDDWMDYNNELRIGILEAYSGIFAGLSKGGHVLLSWCIGQHNASQRPAWWLCGSHVPCPEACS